MWNVLAIKMGGNNSNKPSGDSGIENGLIVSLSLRGWQEVYLEQDNSIQVVRGPEGKRLKAIRKRRAQGDFVAFVRASLFGFGTRVATPVDQFPSGLTPSAQAYPSPSAPQMMSFSPQIQPSSLPPTFGHFVTPAPQFNQVMDHGAVQLSLGYSHENGSGGHKKDLHEALKCYRLSADMGNASAQFRLAWFYQNGVAVQQNVPEARKLLQLAAAQGHSKQRVGRASRPCLRRLEID